MTSFFSQASPPPFKSPLPTPPPPPQKRKRDQLLSPGGKIFDLSLYLYYSLTKRGLPERCYKVRKHWTPKAKRGQEHEMEYNNDSQHSEVLQEPVRRSARAKSKVPTYKVDDVTEE